MLNLVRTVYTAGWVLGLLLALTACGTIATPEDIPPMPVEAQAGPETPAVPPTDLPVEIQGDPTAVGLPTEIGIPVSPVSPVAPPTGETAIAPADQVASPLPGSEAAVAAAIADLTQQTGLPADQITITSVEAIQWPDASLGCPQEGMMYAQVITPGFLIVLTAQGQTYEYHTDQNLTVALCNK